MTTQQAPKTAKKRINVVGAVIRDNGLILAAQRGPKMSLAGMWEFPGGKIEPGETPQEALSRELSEELLCSAQIGAHLDTTEYEYDFGIVVLSTYLCQLTSGKPQLTEHSAIVWAPVEELAQLDWAPADLPAVQKLIGGQVQ